jgi:hypothetical protein
MRKVSIPMRKAMNIGAPNKKHVNLNAENAMASYSLITHMNTGISNNHLEFTSENANLCHPRDPKGMWGYPRRPTSNYMQKKSLADSPNEYRYSCENKNAENLNKGSQCLLPNNNPHEL